MNLIPELTKAQCSLVGAWGPAIKDALTGSTLFQVSTHIKHIKHLFRRCCMYYGLVLYNSGTRTGLGDWRAIPGRGSALCVSPRRERCAGRHAVRELFISRLCRGDHRDVQLASGDQRNLVDVGQLRRQNSRARLSVSLPPARHHRVRCRQERCFHTHLQCWYEYSTSII